MASESVMPIIDVRICTGCGKCVTHCPAQALGMRDERAALIFPERCSYCAACQDVCPEGAIALPYEVVFE